MHKREEALYVVRETVRARQRKRNRAKETKRHGEGDQRRKQKSEIKAHIRDRDTQ